MTSNIYTGAQCPVCGERFGEKDDVVVCPDCGTPHHRECYHKLGECANKELHATGKAWSPHMDSSTVDGFEPLKCSRCGMVNPPDTLFCQVCGTQLGGEVQEGMPRADGSPQQEQGGIPTLDSLFSVRTMPYNPFVNPFGGLDPEESIDGIPVKDIAIFLGDNTHYFLPVFKAMDKSGSKFSWNWGAFIFNAYYYFYRRMNAIAVLLLLVSTALAIPNILVMIVQTPELTTLLKNVNIDIDTLSNVYMFASAIAFGISLLSGIFTNWLYMRHTFSKIREIQQNYQDKPEYNEMLARHGGTSKRNVLIVLAALFVIMTVLFTVTIGALL